jgi:PAS domain S-box-containing protein
MTRRKSVTGSGRPDELRAQAEPSAGERVAPPCEPRGTPPPEEVLRLAHELKVHQIELEMQNEELRREQGELEASRARYFELYDLAPVGYFTVSEHGKILEANLTAARLLGLDRGTLLAQPLTRFVVPGDREVWQRHARQLFESGELLSWEMRLSGAGGKPFWALMEAMVTPEVVSGQNVCRLALSDITERRRVEAALQESEERHRVIVESSRDLIFFLDQEGRLRWCNQAAVEFFGSLPADAEFFRGVHANDAASLAAAWRLAREGAGGPDKISFRLRAADGGSRSLEGVFRKITVAGEALSCLVASDVTELTRLRRKVSARQGITGMVGRDPAMLELGDSIRELAGEDVPVLILGESGTGKELVASAIHKEGPRAAKSFIAINCGALPDTLLETELFGHVKGSFTGAHRDKKGRFELADGGSIFLDEVGDLSHAMQVKLLRVLQEGTFEKVGAETSCKVDVRVISASNKDLKREVAARRFREDLYYRLSVVPLTIPPLRERLTDIPLLAAHIVEEEARRSDRRHDPARPPRNVTIARETLALLIAHRWPGNIRELQNVLRFALIKCKGKVILPQHLPPSFGTPGRDSGCRLKGRKPKISADAAVQALKKAGGHPGEAARGLGVSRATLYRHLPKEGK